MSKVKLQQLLTEQLELTNPDFRLEKIGSTLSGSVISDTFKGKSDRQRLRMIWAALERELRAEATQKVGTLLAYTRAEWDIDLPVVPAVRRARASR